MNPSFRKFALAAALLALALPTLSWGEQDKTDTELRL